MRESENRGVRDPRLDRLAKRCPNPTTRRSANTELESRSDDAHALGHQCEPNECQHDDQNLPAIGARPVV